jgi:hypothetical protein
MMSKRLWFGALGLSTMAIMAASPAALAEPAVPAVDPDTRPAGASIQMLPVAGIPGSTVTVKGTGCAIDGTGRMAKVSIGAGDEIPADPAPAAADGTWSISASVPAGTAPGRYEVTAMCGDAQGSWTYEPGVYIVTAPGVTPEVKVSATTVKPGDELTVSGKGCTPQKDRRTHVEVLDAFRGLNEMHVTMVIPTETGDWTTTLQVPDQPAFGKQLLGAHCVVDGEIHEFYVPATMTVIDGSSPAPERTPPSGSRPGPKPVKVSPRYTG